MTLLWIRIYLFHVVLLIPLLSFLPRSSPLFSVHIPFPYDGLDDGYVTYACIYRILSLPKARLYSHFAHGILQYVCVASSEPATIFYCEGTTVQVSFPKNNADKTLMCEERNALFRNL